MVGKRRRRPETASRISLPGFSRQSVPQQSKALLRLGMFEALWSRPLAYWSQTTKVRGQIFFQGTWTPFDHQRADKHKTICVYRSNLIHVSSPPVRYSDRIPFSTCWLSAWNAINVIFLDHYGSGFDWQQQETLTLLHQHLCFMKDAAECHSAVLWGFQQGGTPVCHREAARLLMMQQWLLVAKDRMTHSINFLCLRFKIKTLWWCLRQEAVKYVCSVQSFDSLK